MWSWVTLWAFPVLPCSSDCWRQTTYWRYEILWAAMWFRETGSLTNSPSCCLASWLGQWPEISWWGLWGKKKQSVSPKLYHVKSVLSLSLSLSRKNCQKVLSRTVKMTNVSSTKVPWQPVRGDEGLLSELCPFDNLLIEESEHLFQPSGPFLRP